MKKLFGKLGGGPIEQTKMAPDFVKNVEHYDNYKNAVDLLVDRFEGMMQQNPTVLEKQMIESPPNENPHEKLAASLAVYQTYFLSDRANQIKDMTNECKKLAEIERQHQVNSRKAIRHLRRFYITEYKVVSDARAKLNKVREHMDLMKHEVKQAKTTEQIEKKAVSYEQAVADFEVEAAKVIELTGQLPMIQQNHTKDIAEYFEILTQLHTKMANAIAKRDFN